MEGWLAFLAGIITMAGIYGLVTMALNLEFGKTGLIDLGIVSFFGIGAYTYTLLTIPAPGPLDQYRIGLGLPMPVGAVGAVLVAAFVAYLIGLPTLRLRGEYLAIATYAFAAVLTQIYANENWLTNGVIGFHGMRQPWRELFGGHAYQFFLMAVVVAVVALAYLFLRRVSKSPFGRTLKAIRENEEVALAVGKNLAAFRMRSFVLAGAVAGLGGVLYVWFTTVVIPGMFIPEVTWVAWISLVLGGTGNFRGALLGTLILIGAQEATRFFQASAEMATILAAIRFIAMGLLMVLIIRFNPRGILPEEREEV